MSPDITLTGFIRVNTPEGPALLRVEDIGHVVTTGKGGGTPPTARSIVYERPGLRDVPRCIMVCETVEQVEQLLGQQGEHGRMVQLVLKAATIRTASPSLEVGLGGLTVAQRDGKFWLRVFGSGSMLGWEETSEPIFLQRVDALAAQMLLWERK